MKAAGFTAPRLRLAIACAIALALAAAAAIDPWTRLDRGLFDWRTAFRGEPAPKAAGDSIVVVGIDAGSSKSMAEPFALWHRHLGRFLEGLREARPAVVGLDLVLPDRSYDTLAPGLDGALIRGLVLSRQAYPTIIARTVDEGGNPRAILPAFVTAAGREPGYALWHTDADGVIRRFSERLGAGGEGVPTLVGEMVRALGKEPGEGYVDFGVGKPFDYVPFAEVLAAIERGDGEALRGRFSGKAVLVGVALPHLDTVRVPARLASWGPPAEATPGVLLHAQALRAVLADRMLAPVPAASVSLAVLLASLVAGITARPVLGTFLLAAACIALLATALLLFEAGYVLPVAWALGAAVAGWALRQGFALVARLLERRRLRRSFSGYVSPGVMTEILKGGIAPGTGGEVRYVCLLFSDIRGYTTRSEGMDPSALLDFLNGYFEGVVEILHRHGGTVTCFMGDGVMAVFGAPQPLANPCESAYRAAREMLENLKAVNARLAAEGGAPLDVGIGLHAGEAVMGHVGGAQRHDYTAIGDVTNTASRLESSSKDAGFRIVMSEEVAGHLASREGLVALGSLSLKGRSPVVAFGCDPVSSPGRPMPS